MLELHFSFMHSSKPWLFWGVLIFVIVISFLLLIEVEHRQTGLRRYDLWLAAAKAVGSGFRSGLRGYFAPLHKAPWRAAWCAYQDPAGRWWSPLAAWVSSIERITFGPSPSSSRDRERNGPVA